MGDVLLLLAHPRRRSFCHGVADRVAERLLELGHTVWSHDLHAELFDPVMNVDEAHTSGPDIEEHLRHEPDPLVARHREELRRAESLVMVHPVWWGMPPAILTGWIDRVVVPGVAYHLDTPAGLPTTLGSLRDLVVVNTSDTPAEREAEVYGDPLATIWGRCIAPFLGAPTVTRTVLAPVGGSTPDQRERWLDEVDRLVSCTLGPAVVQGVDPRP